MSVYRRPGSDIWTYDFEYKGVRYRGSTGQLTRQDAELVEREKKLDARRRDAGIAMPTPTASPTIQDWAEVYYEHVAKRVKRPEVQEHLLRAALRFWGARPTDPAKVTAGAPYHHLRLNDVAQHPAWLLKWEQWLESRRLAPQTKNHYRTLMYQLFQLALHPAYRGITGLTANPFAGQWRDPVRGRTVIIDREDLLAIIGQASWHLRLTMTIALLAPKLRLGNILALEWRKHIAPDCSRITVRDHKTDRATKRPLIAYVPEQLRAVLKEAKRRARGSRYVVTYQGAPIRQVTGAVKAAVQRAAATRRHLTYGRGVDGGITFHTLRHTAATLLAELDVAPEKRQQLLGHKDLQTTMLYTHLPARHEAETAERLSAALPELQALTLVERRRPPRGEKRGDSRQSTRRFSRKTA